MAKVKFSRTEETDITSIPITDGQLIYTKSGKCYLDYGTERIETNRKKVGAMIGDQVEVGCGSVLNPGTVIGKNTNIYPLSSVRGVVPENSIYKNQNEIVTKK